MADEIKEAAKNLAEVNKMVTENAARTQEYKKMLQDQTITQAELEKIMKSVESYRNNLFIDPKKLGVSEDRAKGLNQKLAIFSDTMKNVSGNADAVAANMGNMVASLRDFHNEQERSEKILKERRKNVQEDLEDARKKEKWWAVEKSLDEKLSEVIKKHGEISGELTSGWRGMLVSNINDKVFDPIKNNPIIKMLGLSGLTSIAQGWALDKGRKWLEGNRERRFDKQRVAITKAQYRNLSTAKMGTDLEQIEMGILQKQVEQSRDPITGEIDDKGRAFKQLLELWENIGARASLEDGLTPEMFEDNLKASFNKVFDQIKTPTKDLAEDIINSANNEIINATHKLEERNNQLDQENDIKTQSLLNRILETESKKHQKTLDTIEKNIIQTRIDLEKQLISGDKRLITEEIERKIDLLHESKELEEQKFQKLQEEYSIKKDSLRTETKNIEETKKIIDQQKKLQDKTENILEKLQSGQIDLISSQDISELKSLSGIETNNLSDSVYEAGVGLLVKTLTKLLTGSGPVGEYIHKLWETTAKRDKKIGQQERTFSHPLSQKQGLQDEKASNIGDGVLGQFGKIGDAAKKLGGGGLLLLQKTIGGISGVLGNLMTPLKGMGGLLSGGGITGFLTSLGAGIAGLLGSIAAIGPAGIALGLAGLTGISLNLLIVGNAIKAAATGIGSILGGLGKVITSIGEGIKKGGQAIVDTFKGLSEVGWGGIVKGITTIAGLGLALRTFGKASIFAVPALMATGFMFKTLSGLFKSIPESTKLFDTAKGFVELAKGVRTFAMSSMLLIPTLPMYAALSALPIVGKLIDLQKSKQNSINSNTGSVSITTDDVRISGTRLRSADSDSRRLQKDDTGSVVAPVVASSTTDNSITEINVAEAPLTIRDYNQSPQQLYFA